MCYALGSISTSLCLAKLSHKKDPRLEGSLNAGSTNMYRLYGRKIAMLTLLGDCSKTILALYLAAYFLLPSWAIIPQGVALILGHCFPIYHDFKGGKGVAVALSLLAYHMMPLALLAIGIWFALLILSGRVSVASIGAAITASLVSLHVGTLSEITLLTVVTTIIVFQHRDNIRRLYTGHEHTLITPLLKRLLSK